MAKRRQKNKLSAILGMIIGVIVMIGVGGLFINGTMLEVVVLNLLPLIVHQVVGWFIVGSSILSLILYFAGK